MKYYPQYNNFVTWPAMLIPPAVYVVVAVLASRSVTPGKPVLPAGLLKNVLRVYNVVQIVLCTYMTIGLLPCVQPPNVFGINTEFDAAGEWFIFVHYLSKFLDWFDTFFIIVKNSFSNHVSSIPMTHNFIFRRKVQDTKSIFSATNIRNT